MFSSSKELHSISLWLMATHSDDKATLVVAIIGVLLGLFSVALTIYLNFIRKPKLRVRFFFAPQMRLPAQNLEPIRPSLTVENRGPGIIKLEEATIRIRPAYCRLFGKKTVQSIQPHVAWGLFYEPLDVKHVPGQCVFPLDYDSGERTVRCLLDLNPLRIGVQDWWGRLHWAPREDLEKAQQNYAQYKDFLAKARPD